MKELNRMKQACEEFYQMLDDFKDDEKLTNRHLIEIVSDFVANLSCLIEGAKKRIDPLLSEKATVISIEDFKKLAKHNVDADLYIPDHKINDGETELFSDGHRSVSLVVLGIDDDGEACLCFYDYQVEKWCSYENKRLTHEVVDIAYWSYLPVYTYKRNNYVNFYEVI